MKAQTLTMLALLTIPGLAQGQGTKPKPKPATPAQTGGPVVLGTKQLPGDFGKLGTTYTLGKAIPLNITLVRAEYSTERLTQQELTGMAPEYFHGGAYVANVLPKADRKLLIVHGIAQNPVNKEVEINAESIKFTAVTSKDENIGICGVFSAEGGKKLLDSRLKPGQKVAFYTAFLVPDEGEVPKLIVARQGENQPVIRYDLRGKATGVPSPPRDLVGTRDFFYSTEFIDWKLTKAELTEGNLGTYEPGENKKWLVVTCVFKGGWQKPSSGEPTVGMKALDATLQTADGENLEFYVFNRPGGFTDQFLLGRRDEIFSGSPEDGQEVTVRMAFAMSKGAEPNKLVIKQGPFRTVRFDVKDLLKG